MDTQSWDFETLDGASSSGASSSGPSSSGPALGGPVPVEPPRQYRPDPASQSPPGSPSGPTPLLSPPVESSEQPESPVVPLVTPARGWGWRALVAFVAGGLLTGAGFTVGQLSSAEESAPDSGLTSVSVDGVPVPTPSTLPPTTVPLPSDGATEPAQLVAELLGPSVVQINTSTGTGSGVIYSDGLILTNHHVIEGATDITVQLSDGRHLRGEVLGSDPNADIAVISVGEGHDLPLATLATGKAQVGQTAIAIGSPFRLQQTVTEGIVSAVDRPVPSGQFYTAMIQTDAPINPGNSGGALADRFGRVIGINTAIQTGGSGNTNAGVGFAIPIDTAVSVADRIVAGEPIEPGFLGVTGGPSSDGSAGVEVTEVTGGTAAEDAGLLVGDRILSIDGAPVSLFEELAGLVVARQPGDLVELEVVRGNELLILSATLGRRDE